MLYVIVVVLLTAAVLTPIFMFLEGKSVKQSEEGCTTMPKSVQALEESTQTEEGK